jgi:hypothetical protein
LRFNLPVDAVLIAYGFDPVPIFVAGNQDKIEVNKWGGVIVDEDQMTSVPGVFAGGVSSAAPIWSCVPCATAAKPPPVFTSIYRAELRQQRLRLACSRPDIYSDPPLHERFPSRYRNR